MSLQVWLPLNGSLENKGISNDLIIDGDATYSNFGKIGGKSKNGGAKITMPYNPMKKTGTICFWLYVDENTTGYNGGIFGNNSNRKWTLFLYPDRNSLHSWGCVKDDSTSTPNGSYTINNIIPDETWTHVAVSHNESKEYIYINGKLIKTVNWDSNGTFTFDLSTQILYINQGVLFNDFRIYDECLPEREVKKISQGLVAHYRLDNECGGENILIGSNKIINYGNATGITSTLTEEGYLQVVAESGNGNWKRFDLNGDNTTAIKNNMTVGDIFVISYDIKIVSGKGIPQLFINAGNGYEAMIGNTSLVGEWQRVYKIRTWKEPRNILWIYIFTFRFLRTRRNLFI